MPAHCFNFSETVSGQKEGCVIDHTPYSTDLTPPNYFLFPKQKIPMTGHNFGLVEEIQTSVMEVLKTIPKEEFSVAY